jgi:hypothetical protein
MDHESAIQTNAVERYLLGEMPVEERDSFEAHYFDCAACAEDIRLGSAMTRDFKAVLRQGIPTRSRFGWFQVPTLVPACAALALLVVVGYQNLVTFPELKKAPIALGDAVILDPQTRAGGPEVSAGDGLQFQMPLETISAGEKLRVELLDASGQRRAYTEVQAPPEHKPLDIAFRVSPDPGRYVLLVREAAGDKEVFRGSFRIVPGPRHEGDSR